MPDWSTRSAVAKLDPEQRLVFGWQSSVTDDAGQPIVDHHQDMIAPAEIEPAVYKYVEESRAATEMHDAPAGHLVECLVSTPEKRAAMGLHFDRAPDDVIKALQVLPPNDRAAMEKFIAPLLSKATRVWAGFRVTSDAAWDRVKKGELAEFSLGGSAVREPV